MATVLSSASRSLGERREAYCAGDEACSIGVCGRRGKKIRLCEWEGRKGLKEDHHGGGEVTSKSEGSIGCPTMATSSQV